MSSKKFCTSVSCIDGRVQLPIIHWLQHNHNVTYVDTITEPGMDKFFLDEKKTELVKSKVEISVKAHGSKLILVSAHHDCAGNPISKSEHILQVKKAVSVIKSWRMQVKVIGVWINEDWELEEIKLE